MLLLGGPAPFDDPETSRTLELERRARARVEFARLSARSVANARISGEPLATVMGYDDDGADADVLTPEGPRVEAWTRDDDGKPPAIDNDWLKAQTIEAVTAGFRDVPGFGMIQADATSRRDHDGRYVCTDSACVPSEGVDGQGDPTCGNLAVPAIVWVHQHPMLYVENAERGLQALAEAIANQIAHRSDARQDRIEVHWRIADNLFITEPGTPRWQSATELLAGERTGRIRRRVHNARTAWKGPMGPGA